MNFYFKGDWVPETQPLLFSLGLSGFHTVFLAWGDLLVHQRRVEKTLPFLQSMDNSPEIHCSKSNQVYPLMVSACPPKSICTHAESA